MNPIPTSADEEPQSRAVVSTRTADLVVGGLLFAFALLILWTNYTLGAGWADDGPAAGYFPFRLGVLILLASVAVMVQALRTNDRSAFVEVEQLRLVAIVLVPLIVYIASIGTLGIYVSSSIFIAAFMIFVGKFSWLKAIVTGVAIMLAIFWIFEMQFRVPLPKGPLERLFGY